VQARFNLFSLSSRTWSEVSEMEYKYERVQTDENLPIKILMHTREGQAVIPRHWHESIEISYVISGKLDHIYIDGKEYESHEGDLVLINSNAIHSFTVNVCKNRKTITIFIPYEFMKANYANMDQIAFECISIGNQNRSKEMQFDELREVIQSIVRVSSNRELDPLASIKITGLSYELIYVLLKYFKVDKPAGANIQTQKYLERLTLITQYIKENYQKDLSVQLISTTFNLTPEYLSRFFMKHVGMTVLQYINAIRRGIESFSPDKETKLATFAARCIENENLMHLRSPP
jgi:AraC family transcriptional regulator, melibiose operon regulatory protein